MIIPGLRSAQPEAACGDEGRRISFMAYLHCHNCSWEQDDFWNKSYNPIRFLLTWEKMLLEDNLDAPFKTEDGKDITNRTVLSDALKHHAKRIRTMKWKTQADFMATDKEQGSAQTVGARI